MTKVQINNILCSSLIHQADRFIVESYQVGQAWFSLYKSILSIPNHILILQMFGNGV